MLCSWVAIDTAFVVFDRFILGRSVSICPSSCQYSVIIIIVETKDFFFFFGQD